MAMAIMMTTTKMVRCYFITIVIIVMKMRMMEGRDGVRLWYPAP